MRDLSARPHGELTGLELRDDRARLHRVRDQALVDDAKLDRRLGVTERLVDVATLHGIGENEIRPQVLVEDGRARLERFRRVDDDRQWLVVDRHQVGPTLCSLTRVGDDGGDRVSGVARLVGRQWHVLRAVQARHRDEHRQHTRRLRVLAGDNGHDARLLAGCRRVDAPDPRMCVRTAYERDVDHGREGHVVSERAPTLDELGVLLARSARSDIGGRCRGAHLFTSAGVLIGVVAPRISVAAVRTAFTML